MSLRPSEEEGAAEESAADAGEAMAKDTERAAGVFIVEMCMIAVMLIRMGGIVRRTEWIVMLDRRGQYLHWRRQQLSGTMITL